MADVFEFRFAPSYRVVGALLGIRPSTTSVTIGDGVFTARFGRWTLSTPTDNLASCSLSGGYSRLKTIGPAHLSLADNGLTFATNRDAGLCIRFREPVPGIDPAHKIQHPALTVTVADVHGLREALRPLALID
jgi:hypothetical protein